MYCPTTWHNADGKQHSLKELQNAWRNILSKTKDHNLPYKILFTGGEVTVNKNFLPFVSWLRDHYNDQIFKILVTTNGSASSNYYLKMFRSVDNISFSVHSEHINEQDFFLKMIAIKESLPADKFMHVNIMNEFWNQDRIKLYKQKLDQHGISYSVNQIDYTMQIRPEPVIHGRLDLEV
jgi:MoaA/NifB/PqqE/SkfB family radical SAM enzyme